MSKKATVSDDYLETLEKVKEQYQQYLDVSKVYELPGVRTEEAEERQYPPSPDHPLTTNTFSVK